MGEYIYIGVLRDNNLSEKDLTGLLKIYIQVVDDMCWFTAYQQQVQVNSPDGGTLAGESRSQVTKVALSVSPAGQVTLARWAVGWTNDQLVGRYQPSWVPALIISLLTKVQSCVTITQHALIKGSFANFMPLAAPPPPPPPPSQPLDLSRNWILAIHPHNIAQLTNLCRHLSTLRL